MADMPDPAALAAEIRGHILKKSSRQELLKMLAGAHRAAMTAEQRAEADAADAERAQVLRLQTEMARRARFRAGR
ncbi:protein of unknown function [Streptomyces murinus]